MFLGDRKVGADLGSLSWRLPGSFLTGRPGLASEPSRLARAGKPFDAIVVEIGHPNYMKLHDWNQL